jgi:hypothetical protein
MIISLLKSSMKERKNEKNRESEEGARRPWKSNFHFINKNMDMEYGGNKI